MTALARMRLPARRQARSRTARSRGFTLLETLAVLAIAAVLLAGLASLMSTSYGNARAQQTALYQAQLASGAMQFVKANYATLVPALSAAQPLVVSLGGANVTGNKLSTYMPSALQAVNAYQQTPCLLIFRGSGTGWSGATGGLQDIQAYLVTEGGQTIDDRTLGNIEANGGAGAGAIQAMGNGMVQGAFGSWSVKLAALNPTNASCSGTPTASGHLASEVYYSGDAGAAGDFLYRQPESVTGVADGNTMHAPIVLADDNHVDRTADADCGSGASPNDGQGRVTSDATGNLLYCDGTEWSVEGSMHWRAPVSQYADLSSPGYVPQAGDVALVQADGAAQDQPQGSGEGRAFVYNGAAWEPLGIDQNGNLSVPGLLSLGHQTVGASCSNPASEAQVATDAQGRVLSCQNGTWEPQENLQLVSTNSGCTIQMATAGATDYSECSGPTGWSAYSGQTGTYSYTQNLYVTLSEPGMISATSWSHINDDWCGTTASNEAQMSQDLDIYDASNDDLAHSEAATPRLTNDMAGLNNTLSQAVAQPGTYRIQVVTNWATYAGNTTPWTSSYCGPSGNTIFNTPLVTGWSINTYY